MTQAALEFRTASGLVSVYLAAVAALLAGR